MNGGFKKYEVVYFTEEEKLDMVTRNGEMIQHIDNPTEEMIMVALKNNGAAIRHIKNPTEEMKLVALKTNKKPN